MATPDDTAIEIVDTHLHLWDLKRHRYRWLDPDLRPTALMGDIASIRRNHLLDEYLDEALPLGFVQAVHVEAAPDPPDAVSNTQWLQELATARGFPHAIVALIRLESPNLQATLETHLEATNLRGVRQALNWTPEPDKTNPASTDIFCNPAWLAGFSLLRRFGLSFDMQVDPAQMAAAAKLAASFSETVVILNHVGMPVDRSAEGMALWRRGIRLLAAQPNVIMKISGLTMIDHHWSVESIRLLVLESIDIFGPDRIMFGSNFPVDKLFATLGDLVSAVKTVTATLTHDERTRFFSRNARHYYRLE